VCEPTTVLAVGAGISAVSGGVSAFGNYQQGMAAYKGQKAMTKLRNQQAMTDWAYRKQLQDQEWNQTLKIYDVKKQQFQQQVQENADSLYRAYRDSQIQMNSAIEATKQQNFDAWRTLFGMQGQSAAAGKVGNRAGQQDRVNRMEFGIENQRRLSALTSYGQGLNTNMETLTEQANNANMNAWYGVSIAPQQTPGIPQPLLEPYTATKPSMLGLVGDIGSSVGSAVMSASGLMGAAGTKAEVPGDGTPNTGNPFDKNSALAQSLNIPLINNFQLQYGGL